MAGIVDPSGALVSFQKELRKGRLPVQPAASDPDVLVHFDQQNRRFTYASVTHGRVTALAIFAVCDPIQGLQCFQVGVAVPEDYRKRGRAKSIVNTRIHELRQGLARSGVKEFYIEAIVAADNEASQRVAASTFMANPIEVTDCFAGLPARQYTRKIS